MSYIIARVIKNKMFNYIYVLQFKYHIIIFCAWVIDKYLKYDFVMFDYWYKMNNKENVTYIQPVDTSLYHILIKRRIIK